MTPRLETVPVAVLGYGLPRRTVTRLTHYRLYGLVLTQGEGLQHRKLLEDCPGIILALNPRPSLDGHG